MGLRLWPRFGSKKCNDLQVRAARPHVRAQVPECRIARESLAALGDGYEWEWQPGVRRLERRHLFAAEPNFFEIDYPTNFFEILLFL